MTTLNTKFYSTTGGIPSDFIPISPVNSPRAPSSTDVRGSAGVYPLGKTWIDSSTGSIYQLSGFSTIGGMLSATWVQTGPSSSVGGLIWINNAVSTTLVSNRGYIVTGGSQSFGLPATCTVGDIIEVTRTGLGTSWTITISGSQSISSANIKRTAGQTYGSSGATTYSSARLVCVNSANSEWLALSTTGSVG